MTQYSRTCPSCGGNGGRTSSGALSCVTCGGSGSVFDASWGGTIRAPGINSTRSGYGEFGHPTPSNPDSYSSPISYSPTSSEVGGSAGSGGGEVIFFPFIFPFWLSLQAIRLLFPITLRRSIPIVILFLMALYWASSMPADWMQCSTWQAGHSFCPWEEQGLSIIGLNEMISTEVFGGGASISNVMRAAWIASLSSFSIITVLIIWLWWDYFRDKKRKGYAAAAMWSLLVTNRQISPVFLTILFAPIAALALVSMTGQPIPLPLSLNQSLPVQIDIPSFRAFEREAGAARNNPKNKFSTVQKEISSSHSLVHQRTPLQGSSEIWYNPTGYGGGELRVSEKLARKLIPGGMYTMAIEVKNALPFLQYSLQYDLSYSGVVVTGPAMWHGFTLRIPVLLSLKKTIAQPRFVKGRGLALFSMTINPMMGSMPLPRMPFIQPIAILPSKEGSK